MKSIIQKVFKYFGFKIVKNSIIDKTETFLIKKKLVNNESPVIFDVGANKGQTIRNYLSIFPGAIIHAFEPNNIEAKKIKNQYDNFETVKINNLAVGDKKEKLKFNIRACSGHSSFKKIIPGTKWLEERNKQFNKSGGDYTRETVDVDVISIDDYTEEHNIQNIDILKIDTEGYEDKVLKGCENLLKKNKIKIIFLELIFSEVYENPLNFYDIEKILNPYGFRLFTMTNGGSLLSDIKFKTDLIYVSEEIYQKFKR